MKRSIRLIILLSGLMTVLTACGGGGGGGGTPPAPPPTTTPTKAVLKLSTTGPAGSQIAGVDVTVNLPSGVTVKAATAPPETDAGVVVPSGQAAANSLVIATAASGPPASVRIVLANSNTNGFGIGEFATVTCDLAAGTKPAASAFTIPAALVGDLAGSPISGATVTVAVTLE